MYITLVRRYKMPNRCTYQCLECPSYSGSSKVSFWGRSHILLCHDDHPKFEMSQKSLLDIIKYFPLRFLGSNSAPYHIYEFETGEIGTSKQSFLRPENTIAMDQSTYILRGHSGKRNSLTKDGRQVALFTTEEEGKNRIDFSKQDEALIPVLLLLAIFIDVQSYAYRGATTYTYVPRDKWKSLSEWKPN